MGAGALTLCWAPHSPARLGLGGTLDRLPVVALGRPIDDSFLLLCSSLPLPNAWLLFSSLVGWAVATEAEAGLGQGGHVGKAAVLLIGQWCCHKRCSLGSWGFPGAR